MSKKEELTKYFREIHDKLSRFYGRILLKEDLTLAQFAFLSLLDSAGAIPMSKAGEKLHITKPAVTNLADRLEKNKYLKRIPHPNDRRIYLIRISSKGEKIVRRNHELTVDFILKTLDQFNAGEKQTVVRFYKLLVQSIEEFLSNPKN